MNIKNNIERGVYLEAMSIVEFSTGGHAIMYKTKKAKIKAFKRWFPKNITKDTIFEEKCIFDN